MARGIVTSGNVSVSGTRKSGLRIEITGLEQAVRDLGEARFATALGSAFEVVGVWMVGEGRRRVAPHHFHGVLEGSMKTEVAHSGSIASLSAQVTATGPQTHSFLGGWYSKGGKQPPADAIEAWLSGKGRDPRFAFVVARRIREGYSFKKMRRFFPTMRSIKPRVAEAINIALRAHRV